MSVPAYRGIDIQHHSEYAPNMEPGWAEPGLAGPMFGPKVILDDFISLIL